MEIQQQTQIQTNTEQHKPNTYQYNITIILFLENFLHFVLVLQKTQNNSTTGRTYQSSTTHTSFSFHTTPPLLSSQPLSSPWPLGNGVPESLQIVLPDKTPARHGPHPNLGDERRLADRPGPRKKKPSRGGKKKNPPSWGFFILNLKMC